MGKILDELRQEYAEKESNRKWYQRPAKGDATLYLAARMRDAENATKKAEELAYIIEMSALDIIRRYDSDSKEGKS